MFLRLILQRTFTCFLLSCAAAVPCSGVDLALTVTASTVTVTDVSKGGRVALLGATVDTIRGVQTFSTFSEALIDPDGDGTIVFTPPSGIPVRSVWVAVDIGSGSRAIGSRVGHQVISVIFPLQSLKKNADGLVEALEQNRATLDLLLVRPGDGAWIVRGADGLANDDDSTTGRLKLTFETAAPLGDTKKAPKQLKRGDVVAAIDPLFLEVFLGEIGK
jgi:hypothetical protein